MTAPLTEAELADLQAKCDAATPGEWGIGHHVEHPRVEVSYVAYDYAQGEICTLYLDDASNQANAAFIAMARTAVPRLIADLRAAREREAKLLESLQEIAAFECQEDHDESETLCPYSVARAALATPNAVGTGQCTHDCIGLPGCTACDPRTFGKEGAQRCANCNAKMLCQTADRFCAVCERNGFR